MKDKKGRTKLVCHHSHKNSSLPKWSILKLSNKPMTHCKVIVLTKNSLFLNHQKEIILSAHIQHQPKQDKNMYRKALNENFKWFSGNQRNMYLKARQETSK